MCFAPHHWLRHCKPRWHLLCGTLNMQCVTACCPLASCHASLAAWEFAPIQAAVCAFALMPLLRLGLPGNTDFAKAAVLSDIDDPCIIVHKPIYLIAH